MLQEEGGPSTTEEEEGNPPASPQLAEAFTDDVWGTAKSLVHLKQHKDFDKWKKGKGLTSEGVEGLEKRLDLYQVTI